MMTKFNVGDKVRVLNARGIRVGDDLTVGKLYDVVETRHSGSIVIIDNADDRLVITEREFRHIELAPHKYRTEKRKANVGERILITKAYDTEGEYENGDVFTIDTVLDAGVLVKENDSTAMYHKEYEVIVAEKPPKNERITQLESKVAALEAEVEALQKADKPRKVTPKQPWKPTPNEQRKAVIERAKALVAETQRKMVDNNFTSEGNEFLSYWMTKVEFVVSAEKRTVVAIIRNYKTNAILTKAIAKCAPDDVFNADIGKAITLGRALGLDVSEFENAVKPTEVVVGHKLALKDTVGNDQSGTVSRFDTYFGERCAMFKEGKGASLESAVVLATLSHITDDTDAEYV